LEADFGAVFADSVLAIGEQFFDSLSIASLGWVNRRRVSRLYQEMVQSYKRSNGRLIPHTWKLWMICGIELWFKAVFLGAEIPHRDSANLQM
jgi:hypothetical protein